VCYRNSVNGVVERKRQKNHGSFRQLLRSRQSPEELLEMIRTATDTIHDQWQVADLVQKSCSNAGSTCIPSYRTKRCWPLTSHPWGTSLPWSSSWRRPATSATPMEQSFVSQFSRKDRKRFLSCLRIYFRWITLIVWRWLSPSQRGFCQTVFAQ